MSETRSTIHKIEVWFRNVFVMLSPVLLSLAVAMAVVYYFNYQRNLSVQTKLKLWQEKAEVVLESTRADFTFSDIFTRYGNRFAAEIEKHGPEEYSGPIVTQALQKSFPNDFGLESAEIWAFNFVKDRAVSIRGPNLATTRLKIMERVLNSLAEISSDPLISQSRLQRLEKTVKGILGQHSAPVQLGKNREGRLTPVTFEGNPCYIYWRLFKTANKPFGGVAILIPSTRVEDSEFAMRHIAESSFENYNHRLAVAFVPTTGFQNKRPVIFPKQFEAIPQEREQILALLSEIQRRSAKESSSVSGSENVDFFENYLYLKDYTNVNVPYDAVVFAPLPFDLQVTQIDKDPVFLIIFMAWLIVFSAFYFKTGRAGLPLSLSFRLLFFLTGLLPLLLMVALGTLLIDNSYLNAEKELRQSNLRKLADIHEKSENLATLFGNNISRMISELGLYPLLTSSSPDDINKAFEMLGDRLTKIELSLDSLLLFQPGGLSLLLVKDKRMQQKARILYNLYGPAAHQINKRYSELLTLEEIKLDAAQKTFMQIFGGFHNSFLDEIFMYSYEKENTISFGDSSHDYYYSTILTKDRKIRSYVVFIANSDSLFRVFLRRELDSMNVSDSALFIAAEEQSNSEFTIFPFRKLNALNSRSGQLALGFLRQCRDSVFARHISDSNNMYLFYPMPKMQKYAGGCVVSLSEINRERDLKKLLLYSSTILIICLMYLLAAHASEYLLKPLNQINDVLNHISQGELNNNLIIDRSDELGMLSKILMQMQSGLRIRQTLGKFVSSTFDQSLEKTINIREVAKARKFEGTIIFSDIRSFTTLSEKHTPSDIAGMLNTHMEKLSGEIKSRGGQIEQFIGDAIVAFFPDNNDNDSIINAFNAAAAMYEKHREICLERQQSGHFVYEIGIGLSHGDLIAGPLITQERSEFILIGDAKAEAEEFEQQSKLGRYSKIVVSKKIMQLLSELYGIKFMAIKPDVFEAIVMEPRT